MRTKLGLGAGVALTAAAIAIGGCGSKTTNINGSTGGELNNNGFPASSIAQNNLASDGGGFSENNQTANFTFFTCKFNFPHANSDAPSTADKSGMFFFSTADNGTTTNGAHEHLFLSYWNGSSFTPPQEVTGQDRNEKLGQGATNIGAAVMIPMNTSGYVGAGTSSSPNARVRANQGNWVIFWDGTTFTTNPALTNPITGTGSNTGVQTSDAVGPHHTLFCTVFVKALASQPLANTTLIGNTATSGTANGPSIECHNGFQYMGTEVVANRNGASNPSGLSFLGQTFPGRAGYVSSVGGVDQLVKPAEDIGSFGVASDTIVGCATFTGTNDDLNGANSGGTQLGNFGGGQSAFGTSTGAGNSGVTSAAPSSAKYEVGDSTSFIQIFYTQLVTSGANLNRVSTTFTPTASNGTVQLGPTWELFSANFNLATMTVGGAANPSTPTGQVIVAAPATRNTFTDGRRASTSPHAQLVTYNNLLFWNYNDSSLAVAPSSNPGSAEAVIQSTSNILSEVAVIAGANGDAALANQNDITLLGAAGKHQTINSTPPGSSNPTDVGNESVNIGLCKGCGIIGPDEGQQDVVAFVLGTVSTTTTHGGAATNNNIDQELWAVAFQAAGANAGTLQAFTNNPKRISSHVADLPFPTTTNTNYTGLHDSVNDVKIVGARDGTYYNLAWRQATGTSITANLSLIAQTYKVFRVASTTSASTTVPTLDQRFPTAAPLQVNTTLTAYSTLNTGVGTGHTAWWSSPPVAAYQFQGNLGYHCGFQSDRTKMSIFWLYSDGTNDRLFVKLLTVGTGTLPTDAPTLTATGETEIDASAAVPGIGVNNLQSGTQRATYNFLPGAWNEVIPNYSVNPLNLGAGGWSNPDCSNLQAKQSSWSTLDSCDAGVNATGGGGDCLVVFSKVVSATDNAYDKQVIGALYNQTAISDRVVLSRNFVESTGSPPGGSIGVAFPNGTSLGVPNDAVGGVPVGHAPKYGGNFSGFRTALHGTFPNSRSASISTPARAPDNGAYVYFSAPDNTNASSAAGLFTRHFRKRSATSGGTAVTFAANFFPAASAATGDAAFKNPTRIDRGELNSDAFPAFRPLFKGKQVVVVFTQDNHLWGTVSSDGETYTNNGGQPSAFLVDNNISNKTGGFTGLGISQFPCLLIDSNCDDLSGTALFFIKQDVNLNPRLYVRVMQ